VAIRLVDTNVISFLLKAHTLAASYQPYLTGYTLAVSFMTVAEMREGAVLARWGQRRLTQLENTLRQLLILHSDDDICSKWAEIRAARRAQPIGVADAWIAATALAHGLELVTHDAIDFRNIAGLTILTATP
jgi:predicted nucleic acid-binding protein